MSYMQDPRVHRHFLHHHYGKFIKTNPTGSYYDLPQETYQRALERNTHLNVMGTNMTTPSMLLPPPNVPDGAMPFFRSMYLP